MSAARILLLEDNPHDRELLERTLRVNGVTCEIVHVESEQAFQTVLEKAKADLIISDFSLPSYDGMAALALVQKLQPETPFIFVSGTIGEDRAVESLKSGATDYILKNRLERLVPAVRRALREAQERTERRQIEQQLRQAQKMETIGQLVGGVAHDFNNLLVVIRGNAELVLMDVEQLSEDARESLKQIVAASERAANLIRQLLALGRQQVMRLQPLNLNEVVEDLTRMLDRIIGEKIHLHCSYTMPLPLCKADVGMMEQVLVNLIVNARDAMPHGGQLTIATEKTNLDEAHAAVHPETRAGEFVCLTVSDTGTGIASEHLPRIFEPMFTTKEQGKGTGLGLATVYGIVKQHQGWIEVSSRVGVGSSFKIFIPAIASPATTATRPEAEANLPGGNEGVLLVEDDVGVRIMTRRVLETVGYRIWEAATSREALDIWKTRAPAIDLLFTDIILPDGLTGRELAEQLWAQRPALKVIFTSGYSADVAGKDTEFLRRTKSYFLQKPCPAPTLIMMVRRCLDGE
ncbi:MAG: response regulator [Verrucomicrobia bacterium]|nr:response regulator [Verrucomicrobiota bacterium]